MINCVLFEAFTIHVSRFTIMDKQPSNNNLLYRYMGFAFQVMAGLALGVFAGHALDKWIKPGIPIFIWLLPLLVIIGIFIKVVKDTSGK